MVYVGLEYASTRPIGLLAAFVQCELRRYMHMWVGGWVCTYMSEKTPISRRCVSFRLKDYELQELSLIAIRLLCNSFVGDIVRLFYMCKLLYLLLEWGHC